MKLPLYQVKVSLVSCELLVEISMELTLDHWYAVNRQGKIPCQTHYCWFGCEVYYSPPTQKVVSSPTNGTCHMIGFDGRELHVQVDVSAQILASFLQ